MASSLTNFVLRVVLVDGKDFTPMGEAQVSTTIEWEDFAQTLYNMTIPVASTLLKYLPSKPAGEGLSIDDGDWWYRFVVPINHPIIYAIAAATQVEEYNVAANKGEWKLLNCQTGLRFMLDKIFYGDGMSEAIIEVQHQLQKDRLRVEQQLDDAAEADMALEERILQQEEHKKQAESQMEAEYRGYYDQIARQPALPILSSPTAVPSFPSLLQYPIRRAAYQPETEAEIEADQSAAMTQVAGFSCARDLPSTYQPPAVAAGPGRPLDPQAKRRFLRPHTKKKKAAGGVPVVVEEVEEVEDGEEVDVEEEAVKKRKEQVDARAARAARRSGAK